MNRAERLHTIWNILEELSMQYLSSLLERLKHDEASVLTEISEMLRVELTAEEFATYVQMRRARAQGSTQGRNGKQDLIQQIFTKWNEDHRTVEWKNIDGTYPHYWLWLCSLFIKNNQVRAAQFLFWIASPGTMRNEPDSVNADIITQLFKQLTV